jgi:Flp pilus assembly protein TadD
MKIKAFLSLAGIVCILVLVSCEKPEYGESKKEPAKSPAVGMALNAPQEFPNKDAAMKNDEGISHLKQEHWDISTRYFREAIDMDPSLAEAHFNLGLALDEMGEHQEASAHFRKAKELAPDNPKIAENEILKKHL